VLFPSRCRTEPGHRIGPELLQEAAQGPRSWDLPTVPPSRLKASGWRSGTFSL